MNQHAIKFNDPSAPTVAPVSPLLELGAYGAGLDQPKVA
jgi:hypothetical protein